MDNDLLLCMFFPTAMLMVTYYKTYRIRMISKFIMATTLLPSSVFFPVKTKSVRESHFWHFFPFFHMFKNHLHARIFDIFHGQSGFFTNTAKNFFTGANDFFTGRKMKFTRVGILLSRTDSYYCLLPRFQFYSR